MKKHLIFEGAELSGKSFLMSQVYPVLEARNQTSADYMDGAFWINSDIGIMGGKWAERIVENYVEMAEILAEKPILFEKLFLTDMVYKKQSDKPVPDYVKVIERLQKMNFGIVLTTFDEDEKVISKRLEDRLRLYPHYGRIAKKPEFYIRQQRMYLEMVKNTRLPYMEVRLRNFSAEETERVWQFK